MNQRHLKLVISFIVTKASDMKIMSQCESDREAQAGSTYTAHLSPASWAQRVKVTGLWVSSQ